MYFQNIIYINDIMQSCVKKDRWMNINVSGDNILRVKDCTGKKKIYFASHLSHLSHLSTVLDTFCISSL
jgi:hypothetical protein